MADSDFFVDVLVVGAGPVGLMAASQLARAGVSVRLIDAASGPATTSRALGAHARSLEIYDQLGILGDITAQGTRVNAFIRHQTDGTWRSDFDFGSLPTQFPYMFNIDQVVIERVLRAHAVSAGVDVEWSTRLETFEQDEEGVTVQLHHGGDSGGHENTVRARYLWGCDGGHSTVRKILGLPLEGDSSHTWLIADAIVHTDLDRDGVHWLFAEGSTLMLFPFPEPSKWRLLDTSGEGDIDRPSEIARQFATKISLALRRETAVDEPSWTSKFTIQQRAVPAMHVGRCFVSGDAAHVHSPASGQGLNTGVQDAYNLAWKLAMVLCGDADETLLDTYDTERVPIGQALLASTGVVMNTTMQAPGDQESRESDSTFARKLIANMSGLSIGYSDGPLTVRDESVRTGPRPGERLTQVTAVDAQSPGWMALRAILREPGWKLLEFPSDGRPAARAPELPSWLRTVTIGRTRLADDDSVWDVDGRVRDTLTAADGDWMLVRPDGYLSSRGASDTSGLDVLHRLSGVHA